MQLIALYLPGQECGWHCGSWTWSYEEDGRAVCFHHHSINSNATGASWNLHTAGFVHSKRGYTV